jgi:hypothetical protein
MIALVMAFYILSFQPQLPDAPLTQSLPKTYLSHVWDNYEIPNNQTTLFTRLSRSPEIASIMRDNDTGATTGFKVHVHTFDSYRVTLGYTSKPLCVFLPPGPKCK